MSLEEKNKYIVEYIHKVVEATNEFLPNLIDVAKEKKAIDMFINSNQDVSKIENQIHDLVEDMIKDKLQQDAVYEEIISKNIAPKSEEELMAFTLNLGNDKNGLYLSQQQIDLLMITELSSKKELYDYISNLTCQFTEEDVKRIIAYSQSMDLDSAKRKLYDEYLKTLDTYLDDAVMSDEEKAISKLTKLGIDLKKQQNILSYMHQNGIEKTLIYLRQLEGDQFVVKFNRLMRDDFENVKSIGYDEMSALGRLIDRDKSIDSIIIATGKYGNVMYSCGNGEYFDSYLNDKALQYCYKHNLHMRYHALFDYMHIEALMNQGKTIKDKEEILSDMRIYIKKTFDYINSHNKTLADGSKLINVVEVFNELVERNKPSDQRMQPYLIKWKKEFGITIKDLMSCFDGIEKPDGVEFMYNETTLTESREKRQKVENVLDEIEMINPGFIDIFGDQSHLSDDDLKNDGEEIKETALMLKRIQGKGKKVEITEHDFHFSIEFLNYFNEAMKNGKYKLSDIKIVKNNIQNRISKYYKNAGLEFERVTYWNLFDKNDHNMVRANKKNLQQNKPLVENMYAGLFDDGKKIDKIVNLSKNKYELDKGPQGLDNKSKVKSLTYKETSKGFANVIILFLVIFFVAIIIVISIYLISKYT